MEKNNLLYTLFMNIWLFPILFMIHDFEEILIVNA